MRLTTRGWVVVGVLLVSIVSAFLFGPRGLNAIVVAGTIAILVGFIQVYRINEVTMTRYAPQYGQLNDTIPVRVIVNTAKPFNAKITDTVPDALSAKNNAQSTTINDTTIRYDLSLDERGEHHIGPLRITAEDVLGLVETNVLFDETTNILVRPNVYLLEGPRREDLVQLYGESGDDRLQFSQLRQYRRGDPVRDIHWKSSAKHPGPEPVVKEFTADEGTRTVEIAAGADPDRADLMAEATASIAIHLLEAGVRVGLTTPNGRVDPYEPTDERTRILNHLARVGPGKINDQYEPQILINATRTGVYLDIEGRKSTFNEIIGRSMSHPDNKPAQPLTDARRISESIT